MGERILTLFGEEPVPEENTAVAKNPVKKSPGAVSAAMAREIDLENLPAGGPDEKKYFTIGEVAAIFKVKTSHIRFWTNEFAIKVRTTRKGDRLYTAAQIRELRAIYHLVKERGFTLTGAKAKLKVQNKLEVETIDLKESLLLLRNKLVAIRNQL